MNLLDYEEITLEWFWETSKQKTFCNPNKARMYLTYITNIAKLIFDKPEYADIKDRIVYLPYDIDFFTKWGYNNICYMSFRKSQSLEETKRREIIGKYLKAYKEIQSAIKYDEITVKYSYEQLKRFGVIRCELKNRIKNR